MIGWQKISVAGGTGPAHAAHNFVSLNEHHDNFSHMLNQLNSYQNLINPKGAGAQ